MYVVSLQEGKDLDEFLAMNPPQAFEVLTHKARINEAKVIPPSKIEEWFMFQSQAENAE